MPVRRPTKSATPATEPQAVAPVKARQARKAAKAAAPRKKAKAMKVKAAKVVAPPAPVVEATAAPVAPTASAPVAKRRRARHARTAAAKTAAKIAAPAAARRARRTRPAAPSALAQALAAQIKERGLSLAAAARAIGVNPVGLRRTLSKNSTPNARTAKRYQRWLRSDAPAAASAAAPRTRVESGSAVLSPSALRLTLGDLLRAAAAPAAPVAPAEPQLAKADRAFLADDLARRVHTASAATRRLVGTVLATLRA